MSENFPGSVILKKPDGTHFAVRKTEDGWEGNSFKLMPDGTIGATYQERDIEPGLIKEAGAQIEKGNNEKLNVFKQEAMALYRKGGYQGQAFNNFSGQPSQEATSFKKKLIELPEQEQQKIAESFFGDTIGQSISNNGNAYLVYMATKGTAFARKFTEMEDARLKSAGYSGGFTL